MVSNGPNGQNYRVLFSILNSPVKMFARKFLEIFKFGISRDFFRKFFGGKLNVENTTIFTVCDLGLTHVRTRLCGRLSWEP